MEPLVSMAVAAPAPSAPTHKVNTWFFMCGPLSLNVFLLGLAWNLRAFKLHDMAVDKVLDMRRDEIPTPRGLARFALSLMGVQMALFGFEWWRRGSQFGVDEVQMELLLVGYCFIAGLLLFCPFDIMHRKCRYSVIRKLSRCLWPFQNFSLDLPPHPTPFVEVFLADGLTSLSKFIQDSAVAWMLLSLSFSQELGELRTSYVSKMKSSPLPYFAASMPYIIRATQCLISFHRTTSANDRFLHLLNTLKYCSSLLVISVGAYPQIMGHVGVRLEKNTLFLFCAVFNSLYSFLWDVIMDWGLGQPNLPRRVMFLRHHLIYRPRWIYYGVIVVDFALRILWVTKWWDWQHFGVDFKMLSMVAEVVRRVIWNVLRVEWQCIKLEILGSKKLSEDSMELEQSLENMPLMTDDSDDDEDERGDNDPVRSLEMGELKKPRAKDDTIIAPAAITVATFSRADKQVTVVSDQSKGATTHHRRPQTSSGNEEEMGLTSASEEA
ncbi:hypothetical protein Poli38472_001607 [Pythium oligandrum]|uniref:EXS domain-containing protein n=1 Tax=Pythium oligandrum TaxID=41045 RepID=A0A8K1FNJ1_PYTOL|nr:hypothetical protein Poli38472_001607 [Pythium oligandrum]|eukprot:TMW69451.1 hypothetical protein Poli38472_001607 [Pythium oligandrum]